MVNCYRLLISELSIAGLCLAGKFDFMKNKQRISDFLMLKKITHFLKVMSLQMKFELPLESGKWWWIILKFKNNRFRTKLPSKIFLESVYMAPLVKIHNFPHLHLFEFLPSVDLSPQKLVCISLNIGPSTKMMVFKIIYIKCTI